MGRATGRPHKRTHGAATMRSPQLTQDLFEAAERNIRRVAMPTLASRPPLNVVGRSHFASVVGVSPVALAYWRTLRAGQGPAIQRTVARRPASASKPSP